MALQDPRPRGRAAGTLEDPARLRGREAQVKSLDALGGDAAVLADIFAPARPRARRAGTRDIGCCGPGHGLVEGAFVGARRGRGGRGSGGSGRAGFCKVTPARSASMARASGNSTPFGLHDEAEDVAADVADPALERLPLGIDLETGARVVVPGAEADVVAALAAELHDAADQVDDVDGLADLFLGIERPARGHRQLPCVRKGEFHFANILVKPRARAASGGQIRLSRRPALGRGENPLREKEAPPPSIRAGAATAGFPSMRRPRDYSPIGKNGQPHGCGGRPGGPDSFAMGSPPSPNAHRLRPVGNEAASNAASHRTPPVGLGGKSMGNEGPPPQGHSLRGRLSGRENPPAGIGPSYIKAKAVPYC